MQTSIVKYNSAGIELTLTIQHNGLSIESYTYTAEVNGKDVTAVCPDPQMYTVKNAMKYGKLVSTEFKRKSISNCITGASMVQVATECIITVSNVQRTEDGIMYEFSNGSMSSTNILEGCFIGTAEALQSIKQQF